jgi:hypothetical protein
MTLREAPTHAERVKMAEDMAHECLEIAYRLTGERWRAQWEGEGPVATAILAAALFEALWSSSRIVPSR